MSLVSLRYLTSYKNNINRTTTLNHHIKMDDNISYTMLVYKQTVQILVIPSEYAYSDY